MDNTKKIDSTTAATEETTTDNNETKKTKKSSKFVLFFKHLGIKMQLLGIWLLKNISVFLQIAIGICIILTLCGIIVPSTPILGSIFGDLSEEVTDLRATYSWDVVLNLIATLLSLSLSFYVVVKKLKTVALSDIKSRKLKLALIDAGLYFDDNNVLCKKLETATNMDLNSDGSIADTKISDTKTENFFSACIRSGKELWLILSFKFNDDESDDDDEVKTLSDKANLTTTTETLSSIDETTKTGYLAKLKNSFSNLKLKIKDMFYSVKSAMQASKEPKLEKTKVAKTTDVTKIKTETPEVKTADKTKIITVVNTETSKTIASANVTSEVKPAKVVEKPVIKQTKQVINTEEKETAAIASTKNVSQSNKIDNIFASMK